METLLIVLHVVVCLFLVAIVLLQHGKGSGYRCDIPGDPASLCSVPNGPLPTVEQDHDSRGCHFYVDFRRPAYISSHTGTGSVMSDLAKPEPVQQTTQPPAQTTTPPVRVEPVKPEPAGDTMPKEQAKAPDTKEPEVKTPEAKPAIPPAAAPAAAEKK